ncbi:N-acetylmuramoyl-L-alanine amidase [Bacillus sp. JJ722]|uniref:N-acetylmuramoyl-L-alanine amidase n=1 Tax=Bacillus sp. JJ722 TaxID=3122973 RepID=UPI002FFFD7BA
MNKEVSEDFKKALKSETAYSIIDFHANAYGTKWNDGNGIETYVYKKTLKDAVKVAKAVQKSIVSATGLRDPGVKESNLHMLRETNPTAILVEGPFMSNRKEAELLKSDSFRRKFALAIVEGVAQAYYLKAEERKMESYVVSIQVLLLVKYLLRILSHKWRKTLMLPYIYVRKVTGIDCTQEHLHLK